MLINREVAAATGSHLVAGSSMRSQVAVADLVAAMLLLCVASILHPIYLEEGHPSHWHCTQSQKMFYS
jgi:hypothetical protein